MIDSKYATLVKAIQECGNISKAAQYLHLTQSAISHQLKKAEEEIELKLFERTSSGLVMTEAGEVIYDYAKKLQEENTRLDARLNLYRHKRDQVYVHGYSNFESNRLIDQAHSISEFIHYDSVWAAGSKILEVGCGVGAQTKILAAKNPECHITSIDHSEKSILTAKADPELKELKNVEFIHLNAFDLTKLNTQFDHIFICFVLEHVNDPQSLLSHVGLVLKPEGTITLVEGDHGSAYFYPESEYATKAVQAQVKYQKENSGNANIGRQLYALLRASDYIDISVSPSCIYVDDNNPELKANFILNTFTAMIEGMKSRIISSGTETEIIMNKGIDHLKRTNQKNGTFSYTFFKGIGVKKGQYSKL
ncbi:MAG: methyltransferase domain-containing protein [Bacteroidota bacterium]